MPRYLYDYMHNKQDRMNYSALIFTIYFNAGSIPHGEINFLVHFGQWPTNIMSKVVSYK